ncbi:hypothetical protein H4R35_003093 [Dimargaris xerosporica]|nr:hypothetical protein H4R35_003093 [Dimargaris xerosporica]
MTKLDYMRYYSEGMVRACIKVGPSSGVVTAFTIIGVNGDQVGFRWNGATPERVETIFLVEDQYVDGIATQSVDVPNGKASADYSIYALKFTDQKINYYVDDELVHTQENKKDGNFPLGANIPALRIWDDNALSGMGLKTDYSKSSEISAYFDWIEFTQHCGDQKPETTTFLSPPNPAEPMQTHEPGAP